jgi:hypothetical protein
MVQEVAKKRRFRPKKFFKKVFSGKLTNKENDVSTSLLHTLTHETEDPSNYEPPTPSKLLVEKSGSDTLNSSTLPQVNESAAPARKAQAGYSSTVHEWEDFEATTRVSIEAPSDETQTAVSGGAEIIKPPVVVRQLQAAASAVPFPFEAQQTSSGDIEVDLVYADLEQRSLAREAKKKSKTKEPPLPLVNISIESIESVVEEDEAAMNWQIQHDGTVELKGDLLVEEEKKDENEHEEVSPPVPASQRARSMSPTTTPSSSVQQGIRRITSLSTGMKYVSPAVANDIDATDIIGELEKQEIIHKSLKKPAAVFASAQIATVPEVDEADCHSSLIDANYGDVKTIEDPSLSITGYTTEEGTEILTSSETTYNTTDERYDDNDEDDADTTFDLDSETCASNENDTPDDEEDGDQDTSLHENDRKTEGNAKDEAQQVLESLPTKDLIDSILETPEMTSEPRRIMGRSPESLEAEEQHGSLSPSRAVEQAQKKSIVTSWSPSDEEHQRGIVTVTSSYTEDGTTTVFSSPFSEDGTTTGASSPELGSTPGTGMSSRAYFAEEESACTEEDFEDDEDKDTFAQIGADLSEMANELREKGPGVLMEWMDIGDVLRK